MKKRFRLCFILFILFVTSIMFACGESHTQSGSYDNSQSSNYSSDSGGENTNGDNSSNDSGGGNTSGDNSSSGGNNSSPEITPSKTGEIEDIKDFYLSKELQYDDTVNYVLRWEKTDNVDYYVINIDDNEYKTKTNELDVTAFVEIGNTYNFSAQAKNLTNTSNTVSLEQKVKQVTLGLTYTLAVGGVEVKAARGVSVSGELVIPDKRNGADVIKVADAGFRGVQAQAIDFPKYLVEIGVCSFDGANVEELTLPSTITKIGLSAFESCVNLKKLTFNCILQESAGSIFSDCVNLEAVIFGEGVKSVCNTMFVGCTKLKTVIFPDSLTEIGERSFAGCHSLKDISFLNKVEALNGSEFLDCDGFTDIILPKNLKEFYYTTFNDCDNLVSIKADEDSEYLLNYNGSIYSKDKKILYYYKPINNENSPVLPEETTTIWDNAFSNCHSFTYVTLSNNIKNIGGGCFYRCNNLRSVVFPEFVDSIASTLFYFCSNLNRVVMPKNITEVNNLYGMATLEWLEISEGVKSIRQLGDMLSPIRILVLPNSTEYFQIKGTYIEKIFYKGTVEEIESVEFDVDEQIPIYFYSEEEPPLNEDGTDYVEGYWHYDENGVPVIWSKTP